MKKLILMAMAVVMLGACGLKLPGSSDKNNEAEAPAQKVNTDSIAKAVRDSIEKTVKDSIAKVRADSMAKAELADKMPTHNQVLRLIEDSWEKKVSDKHPVLSELGMTCLKYEVEDLDYFKCIDAYYGKNAEVKTVKASNGDDMLRPFATGTHAVVVRLSIADDNYQCVYFSEEEDYEAFLETLRPGSHWGPADMEYGMYVVEQKQ